MYTPKKALGIILQLSIASATNINFWFMDLTDPSFEQSGLISIVVGAGAAWFGLYTNSHKKT